MGNKKSRFVRNKADFLHFRQRKFIGEVRIGVADKSFRTVAEPYFYYLSANVLLADSGERVTQVVLFAVGEHPFEDSVGVTVIYGRRQRQTFCFGRDGNTFVFLLPTFSFCVSGNDESVIILCRFYVL